MTGYYSSEVGLPFLIIKRIRFLNAIGSLNALGLSLNALGLRPPGPSLFRMILNNRNICICLKKFV